jgi:hypothetical protein
MASENNLISVSDYNAIRSIASSIMGVGSGSRGYGQTVNSISKSQNQLVSQQDWDLLRLDLLNARIHQNGFQALQEINENDSISAGTVNLYETYRTTIDNDRFNVVNGRFLTEGALPNGDDLIVSRTYSGGAEWKNEISSTLTITFSDANRARYFFNSGGTIRIKSTRTPITGGRTDTQNNAWTNLIKDLGFISFGGQIPETGFAPDRPMNGKNFYRLTSTFQEYYSKSSSSPYGSNRYVLEARCNVADNRSGTANIVYIKIRFIDGYVDPDTVAGIPAGSNAPAEGVEGTFRIEVGEKRANSIGGILPSGNFIIQRPTYAITEITGN